MRARWAHGLDGPRSSDQLEDQKQRWGLYIPSETYVEMIPSYRIHPIPISIITIYSGRYMQSLPFSGTNFPPFSITSLKELTCLLNEPSPLSAQEVMSFLSFSADIVVVVEVELECSSGLEVELAATVPKMRSGRPMSETERAWMRWSLGMCG